MAAEYTAMTVIKLSGSLAKRFGREHRRLIDSRSVWEALRALKATLAGFDEEIKRLDRLGLRFAVFRNRQNAGVDAFDLSGTREIRIVPVLRGSKRAGALQTILGAVLIVVGLVITGGTFGAGAPFGSALITLGASMAAGGVIQMLSPRRAVSAKAHPRKTFPRTRSAARRTPQPAATRSRSASAAGAGAAQSSLPRYTPKTKPDFRMTHTAADWRYFFAWRKAWARHKRSTSPAPKAAAAAQKHRLRLPTACARQTWRSC